MARQNRSTKSADATQAEAPTTEESTVTTETPEAPVADGTQTEGTDAPATPAAEVPVDLTAFKSAVADALAEGDTSTGQLPEASIAKVNEAYRAVEGNKGKGEARKYLEEAMLEAVGKLDAVAARGYSDLKTNLTAAGGSKADKAPSDPAAAFVQRRASLELALHIVNQGAPEVGEDRDLDAEVAKALGEAQELYASHVAHEANEAEDKGDGPTLTPVVRAAIKAAAGKATGSTRTSSGGNSGGVRRDIGKHIESAFAEVEVGGFLTIAEIAKHKSAEYEGTDGPSQGAISARLFPTTTVAGVEPIEKGAIDGKNPKGARKVEVAQA
jgi:hypothetical protein